MTVYSLEQEIFYKLKAFIQSDRNALVDVMCIGFVGPGYRDGQHCYYQASAKKAAISRPFEIWNNCKKMFEPDINNFHHIYRKDKAKLVFVQLIPGRVALLIETYKK